jgi:short-subunit dehydrogenase
MKNYVLITGGTAGIGYELAKLFANDGYNLILVAREEEGLRAAASDLSVYGVQVKTISKDLFDKDNASAIYEELLAENIIVDILVNDAGQGVYGKFNETELQRELDIIQLNVSSLVILTKLFLKDMLKRGSGKILNLSSIAGKVPGPYQAVYHGTKAFVHSFTEAVRSEVKDTGVTLTSLLPGATDTGFFDKADMENSKMVQEGKLDDPATVAKDGFEALMAGKDMVISGFRNKAQVALGSILPDSTAADTMKKQQGPVSES